MSLFKKGIWSLLENIAYPVMMLGLTPVYLKALGVDQYALWILLNTLISLGGICNVGMVGAVTREVAIFFNKNNKRHAQLIIRVGLTITLVTTLAFSIFAKSISNYFEINLIANFSNVEIINTVLNYSLILLALEQCDSVFSSAMKGWDRFDLAAKSEISMKFIILISGSLMVWYTHDILMLIYIFLVFTALRLSVKCIILSRLVGPKIFIPTWDNELAIDLLKFGKWSWLQNIGGVFYSGGDRAIISALLGSTSLVGYTVCLQLSQQIHSIPAAALNWIFPEAARMSSSNPKLPERFLRNSIVSNILLTLVVSIPLLLFGDLFLTIWISKDVANDFNVLFLALIAANIILSLNISAHYILMGFNKQAGIALTNIFGGVLGLILMYMAIPEFGLIGAVYGRIFFAIIVSLNYVNLFKLVKIRNSNG